jgi:hypothetical protein
VNATDPQPPRTVVIRLGTFSRRPRRDITAPTPPGHLFGSSDMRILRAWIEAEQAHPGDAVAAVTAVLTAIDRIQGQRNTSGQVSDVYERLPRWMRPLFGLPAGEGLKRLIGRWDKGGIYQRGAAGLAEDAAKVYWWDIRGWTFEEIQRELTAPGLRHDRAYWRDGDEVNDLLEAARQQVRALFGMP